MQLINANDQPPPAPPRPRHITLGALQKRLGVMRALAIETSTAPKCVALRGFLNRFSYADLDDPDLPQLLGMLAQAELPAPDPEFPGSGPITMDVIASVIGDEVQEIERP
jgi:hypothetical protein